MIQGITGGLVLDTYVYYYELAPRARNNTWELTFEEKKLKSVAFLVFYYCKQNEPFILALVAIYLHW